MNSESLKKMVGEAAAQQVQSNQKLGLGTGSTIRYFLEALQVRLESGEIENIMGVPTSIQTEQQAIQLGIPLTTLADHTQLDLTVDGADEVDPQFNLTKGLGGALLREKIVAAASKQFIVIVDESKMVDQLGTKCPLPIEVLPFGWEVTSRSISSLDGQPVLRMADETPFQTDQGNYILNTTFDGISDVHKLAAALDAIPGVLGHGMFLNLATSVIVGTDSGPRVLSR